MIVSSGAAAERNSADATSQTCRSELQQLPSGQQARVSSVGSHASHGTRFYASTPATSQEIHNSVRQATYTLRMTSSMVVTW